MLFRNKAPKLLPIQNEASVKIPPASTFLELSLPRLLTSKEAFNHLRQGQKKKKPVSYLMRRKLFILEIKWAFTRNSLLP
jgi:hypothetical protein